MDISCFLVPYEMEKRKKTFRYNHKLVCHFGIGFICCREGGVLRWPIFSWFLGAYLVGCKFLMNLKILNKNVCIRAKISHISHALWFPTNNVIPQYFSIISSISLLYQFVIPSLILLTP